jgi:hypothetical protein
VWHSDILLVAYPSRILLLPPNAQVPSRENEARRLASIAGQSPHPFILRLFQGARCWHRQAERERRDFELSWIETTRASPSTRSSASRWKEPTAATPSGKARTRTPTRWRASNPRQSDPPRQKNRSLGEVSGPIFHFCDFCIVTGATGGLLPLRPTAPGRVGCSGTFLQVRRREGRPARPLFFGF